MCVHFFGQFCTNELGNWWCQGDGNKWLWLASRALQDASWILESYLWYWYMFLLYLFVYAHVIKISYTKGHQSLSLIRLVQFSASFEQGSMTIKRDGFRNIMQRNSIFDSFKAPHSQSTLSLHFFQKGFSFTGPTIVAVPAIFWADTCTSQRKTESILPYLLEELFNVYV